MADYQEYHSQFTGTQIDKAVAAVVEKEAIWDSKQDYLAQNVTAFNGRIGAVQPRTGDYTASMVGALPDYTRIPNKTSELDNDAGFITESLAQSQINLSVNQAKEEIGHDVDDKIGSALAGFDLEGQMPKGGTVGQVLTKLSSADYDAEWKNPQVGGTGDEGSGGNVPSGGTKGQILSKTSDIDYDTEWVDMPTIETGGSTDIDPSKLENLVHVDGGAELIIPGSVEKEDASIYDYPYTITFSDEDDGEDFGPVDLTASDVPYDGVESGLIATNVQTAIDEIKELVDASTGGGGNNGATGGTPASGSDVSYDNSSSGLESTTIQGAIDELANESFVNYVAGDGIAISDEEQSVSIRLSPDSGNVATFDSNGALYVPENSDGTSRGVGMLTEGMVVKFPDGTITDGSSTCEIFNDYSIRTFNPSTGDAISGNVATGDYSHAEGVATTATSTGCHAEGGYTKATGIYSHAGGYKSTASGTYSVAAGYQSTASGNGSLALGWGSEASGVSSYSFGYGCKSAGNYSYTFGSTTTATGLYQMVIGTKNKNIDSSSFNKFIIGNGTDSALSNCFRVNDTGVYAGGNYNTSGADYAELFEWADGNLLEEDRAGLFVTLDGENIRIATPDDDYILGVVSGNPSVVGDVYDDQWAKMYLYDVFGRPLFEEVEIPSEYIEVPDTKDPSKCIKEVLVSEHTEIRLKLNPDYNPDEPYIPRTKRPEWDAVGLLGKLVAIDDGTCIVNGYCTVGDGGKATNSAERTKYRVMARIDDSHIKIMIL